MQEKNAEGRPCNGEETGQRFQPVAYCSLYCSKCFKTVVSQSAQALKDALENTHVCGSVHEPSAEFKKELARLVAFRCSRTCRTGAETRNFEGTTAAIVPPFLCLNIIVLVMTSRGKPLASTRSETGCTHLSCSAVIPCF
ncbi:TPA: hypothetical protein HA318_00035 [Candidatus Micrarchaeota archaeon]|nr:hypothetical protein [Candidatus Micrarchaeota archaeon]